MATFKNPKIGLYGSKDRLLQKTLSYEKTSLTWKDAYVYRYLGDENNAVPDINDIGNALFMETADRAYDPNPIRINIWHEILNESPFDLSRFGIINPIGTIYQFRIHINSFEADALGRYIIVGDVIEIPFMEQDGVKALFEVSDLDRKQEFENFFVIVTTVPLEASGETEGLPDGLVDDTYENALTVLHDQLEADQESAYILAGLNAEPDLYAVRGYVEDGYWDELDIFAYDDETTRDPYDPRPDGGATFLDSDTPVKF